MPRAKKLTAPTAKMRSDAIRALHRAVTDPETGDTARGAAARALIRHSADTEAEAAERAACWPKPIVYLPDNGRDDCELGIVEHREMFLILYDADTPEGIAQGEAWRTECEARNDAGEAGSPLALPSPPARLAAV